MSEHSFESAPDMGRDFSNSHDAYEMPLEHDAQSWEPSEPPEIERPSEKHMEMHYTPGGAMEQEIHSEIDEAARIRISEAQQQPSEHDLPDERELDFASDFEEARRNDRGWDPESRREYETLSHEQDDRFDSEPFGTGRRFERGTDQERGDVEWER